MNIRPLRFRLAHEREFANIVYVERQPLVRRRLCRFDDRREVVRFEGTGDIGHGYVGGLVGGGENAIQGADSQGRRYCQLLAGLAIFPLVFANGLDPAAGPGLIFVTLPIAFGSMPAGALFGTVFFLSPDVLLWSIAGVFLLASAIVPRFYCRYACPLGAAKEVPS